MAKKIEKELNDYSGPIMLDLNPGDPKSMSRFSKDALISLMDAAGKMYLGFSGCWNTLNRKNYGEGQANEMDREFWLQWGVPNMAMRWMKFFKIEGTDVATFMKFTQIEPMFVFSISKWELKNPKLGLVTTSRCVALEYCERHGEDRLAKNQCSLHVAGLQAAAKYVNPNILIKPSLLPPRKIEFKERGGRVEPLPLCCVLEISQG